MAGRPKKAEGETRDNILRIRLTDEERTKLNEAARRRGLETSSWARSELLALAREALKQSDVH
jgi:uncharacterized protein (DUF1778 family)